MKQLIDILIVASSFPACQTLYGSRNNEYVSKMRHEYELLRVTEAYSGATIGNVRLVNLPNGARVSTYGPASTAEYGFVDLDAPLLEQLIKQFRLRPDQAAGVLEKHSIEAINRHLYDIRTKALDCKVKNPGSYTAKVFGLGITKEKNEK